MADIRLHSAIQDYTAETCESVLLQMLQGMSVSRYTTQPVTATESTLNKHIRIGSRDQVFDSGGRRGVGDFCFIFDGRYMLFIVSRLHH